MAMAALPSLNSVASSTPEVSGGTMPSGPARRRAHSSARTAAGVATCNCPRSSNTSPPKLQQLRRRRRGLGDERLVVKQRRALVCERQAVERIAIDQRVDGLAQIL